ncbi:MAG TPA: cytochrome c3 family protein [Kofleriaceae bacterium]|nr:cytochrome c3 family protein [Kofleriaceae bacterium]
MVAAPSRPSHPNRPLVAALVLAIIPLAGWATVRHLDGAERAEAAAARARDIAANVPQPIRPGYATSERCEICHPSQYHSWHRGYHRTMTQYASPEAVRGDFANVTLDGGGYEAKLSRRGDDFFVEMVDPLWQYQIDTGQRPPPEPGEAPPRALRRISMVTGSHHMQAYWVPSNEGNSQMSLPFTYLFDDKRWVPRGDVFLHPPDQDRHQEQVWNVSCIRCHTTAGQPLALGGGWKIESKLGENGIACEACHGPAEAHVAANKNPLRRYWLHLRGQGDPTIVNPARISPARAAEVCGQCHSLTDVSEDIELGEGKTYVAGAELEKSQPLLRPLHPSPALERYMADDPLYLRNYFWADGTIRVSSRDFSGMIESKCMSGGKLWCGSCHSLHESDPVNLLAKGKASDAACVSCHPAIGGAVAAHTHHAADSEGSRCFNCHMPYTVYGLLKGIRNHRIDSPKVTGKSGGSERPNACNLCHVDRSLGWAAQQLATWYRQPVPANLASAPGGTIGGVPGGAIGGAPGRTIDDTPAAVDWLLSGDAVLRAVAAWQFGWSGAQKAAQVKQAVPYLVAALVDPYAAVRYVAGHSLQAILPGIQFDYLAPPEARQKAAQDILQRWRTEVPDGERDAAAINARIQRLIDKRDDTPVRAME